MLQMCEINPTRFRSIARLELTFSSYLAKKQGGQLVFPVWNEYWTISTIIGDWGLGIGQNAKQYSEQETNIGNMSPAVHNLAIQ